MPLKLNTASSGSVTLDAANTASNFTVTIPAVTATMLNNQSDITAQVKTATSASGDAPIFAARAWVNFNGTGTVAIRASGNVSSITDNGTGDYTVNFATAMPDANYSAVANCTTNNAFSVQFVCMFNSTVSNNNVTPTTSGFRLSTRESGGTGRDEEFIIASVFR